MKAIIGILCVVVIGALALAFALRGATPVPDEPNVASRPAAPSSGPSAGSVPPHPNAGFLYGRVTTGDITYEGRLRFGGDQEAFWGDFLNGAKRENPWVAHASLERPEEKTSTIEVFGFQLFGPDRSHLRRLFLARFGDVARIEPHVADVRITLKSGTVVVLNRFETGDIDDDLRIWDTTHGIVDVDARRVHAIDFLPTPPLSGVPGRLHGVVATRRGEFTGFIGWNQEDSVGSDTLDGQAREGRVSLRYDTIQSIARQAHDTMVTLRDGRTTVLAGGEAGRENRGIYVDDARYGRVLVSWDAFERVDFSAAGTGPAYTGFPPGEPLAARITTSDGRQLAGRLVYDFDESETTDTLDVSMDGVDYTIPFGLIAAIVPPGRGDGGEAARVVLLTGEELRVERRGDVADRNAGLLIFGDRQDTPAYVRWTEVQRIDFESPAAGVTRSAR